MEFNKNKMIYRILSLPAYVFSGIILQRCGAPLTSPQIHYMWWWGSLEVQKKEHVQMLWPPKNKHIGWERPQTGTIIYHFLTEILFDPKRYLTKLFPFFAEILYLKSSHPSFKNRVVWLVVEKKSSFLVCLGQYAWPGCAWSRPAGSQELDHAGRRFCPRLRSHTGAVLEPHVT